MDWERTQSHWNNHDFSLFTYDSGEIEIPATTTVVSSLSSNDYEFKVETLSSPGDWKLWFDKTKLEKEAGFCVLLYNKVQDLFGADGFASLMSLPVTRNTFTETIQRFQPQPCITRTIMREKVYFSTQSVHDNESRSTRIGTTARTVSFASQDLALSGTYHLEHGLSLGLVFGCTKESTRQIISRLKKVSPEQSHPMLMAGILFELERKRLEECVERLTDDFALTSAEDRPLDLDMGRNEMISYLKKCYRSRELGNEINTLKRQLRNLIEETGAFDETIVVGGRNDKSSGDDEDSEAQVRRRQLKHAGRRIRGRLEEMCDILDDKIDSCNVTIDNMSLTMQTLWNHFAQEDNRINTKFNRVNTQLSTTNKAISQSMQDDSSQMKFIALLTMVFLPISTMASIFSTELFSWDAGPGEAVVSRYLWVFIVISLALTTVVVGAWGLATRYTFLRRRKADDDIEDCEKAG
ncbi:hypothetical protein PGQ11_006304 [Apiospora arundinis]|uniref:Uncharacterized protein n=1 Tax=Apiospora arundinis TaxID=335852 RepID=A0ABR2ISC3_9PEZI